MKKYEGKSGVPVMAVTFRMAVSPDGRLMLVKEGRRRKTHPLDEFPWKAAK